MNRRWLANLAHRYKNGENPESLLRQLETPHRFLGEADLIRLEQLRQALRKKLSDNALLQIEALFQKLDSEARRQCLKRLNEIAAE